MKKFAIKKFCAVLISLAMCAVLLCGCFGLKSFSREDTVKNLKNLNYKLMDMSYPLVVEGTNFYIFDGDSIEKNKISTYFDLQKRYFPTVYGNMNLTFAATEELNDRNVVYDNTYKLIVEGNNNSWSSIIYSACFNSAVLSFVEFWDTTKTGQPIWFCLFKCKCDASGEAYDFAAKLYNLLIDINGVVARDNPDDLPSKDKAYSWALRSEVEIDKCEGSVVMYTQNAKSLIK